MSISASMVMQLTGLGCPRMQRELVYLRAVGKYRVGKLLEARRQLDELLKVPSLPCNLRSWTQAASRWQWMAGVQ
jgi:esterase/lipase superfamily enzyme